jgi:hypothetical protein
VVDQEEIRLKLLNHERSVNLPTSVSLNHLRNVKTLDFAATCGQS